MLHRILAVAALAVALGCADRAPVTAPPADGGTTASLASLSKRPEALAQIVAKGLKNAAFRAYLKAQLDASPYREHKLQFQAFLGSNSGHALRQIAGENGISQESIAAQAQAAIELEVYIPVPAHRAAWTGDESILVATALTDDDPPIAFDANGRRRVLDARTPPATPVLAVVPVETDFSRIPSRVEECIVDCSGGGGGGARSVTSFPHPRRPLVCT